MKTHPSRVVRLSAFVCFVAMVATFSGGLGCVARAAESATGVITGRIFNPARGEYVRDAQVSIVGTALATASEAEGYYRIAGVPEGNITVEVAFTGYQMTRATVAVRGGAEAIQNFELRAPALASPEPDAPVQLAGYVVSASRDGDAKAIMEQRRSMDIANSVSSDRFGDNTEGNVGDFVKHLPGVELDLVEGVARSPRLRGLGSEYTAVTLDGITLASADANVGAAGNARAFSFEQVSLSSMESVEISKTLSADVDANAPAGTINLKTKRAFDRQGRHFAWQTNLTAFTDHFELDRSLGPDDRKRRKIMPGGNFEYSDILLNRRLGFVLNVSESNLYSEANRTVNSYHTVPTAAQPAPVILSAINTSHGPRINERFTTTLTTDFKATPSLVLSLGVIYNYSDLWYVQRNINFTTGARASVKGDDLLRSFTTSAGASVAQSQAAVSKQGETMTYNPRFEYRRGNLVVEGRFAYSDSTSDYQPLRRQGSAFAATTSSAAGNFTAVRGHTDRSDWTIQQISGADWSNGRNFTNPGITADDGRYAVTTVYSGDVSATLRTKGKLPVTWKAGLKSRQESRTFEVRRESFLYSYTGPGGGTTGSWAAYASPYRTDLSMLDSSLATLSGGSVFLPNLLQIGQLFRDHPEYFTRNLTGTNYYNAFIANTKDYKETIDSGFGMATMDLGKLKLRAGLRWEQTKTDSLEFDPRGSAEVAAAGFPVSGGRATTIPGLDYQYLSRPRVHRTADYENFFPSASAKYTIVPNLQAQLGYSRTIRRPTFNDIAGVRIVNDDTMVVTAPNPRLKPEDSDNLSARLAYYFEPIGTVAANVFENRIKGLGLTSDLTAAEFGNTDPELDGYTFRTTRSSEEAITVRGMELEYAQSLSFLPKPFNGLDVYVNYTRNYASQLVTGLVPHSVKTGFNFAYRRFSVRSSYTWNGDMPTNEAGTQFRWRRGVVDAGGVYRLTERTSVFFTVQNLNNAPVVVAQRTAVGDLAQAQGMYGAQWTFGLKGRF